MDHDYTHSSVIFISRTGGGEHFQVFYEVAGRPLTTYPSEDGRFTPRRATFATRSNPGGGVSAWMGDILKLQCLYNNSNFTLKSCIPAKKITSIMDIQCLSEVPALFSPPPAVSGTIKMSHRT